MKTLITRIKRLALALCFVTPLVSWAATEMTNPVTGETETYANTFIGSDGEWNDVSNWSSDTIPLVSGGNFDSSLVDGATAYTSTQINGWTPRVGAYNGATIQWNGGIGKIQTGSVGAWLTADATSTITIASFGGNQLEGSDTYPLKLSSANAGGITWSAGLTSASSTSLPFWYYLKGDGTVVYGGDITVANAQVIKQADVTLSGDSKVAFKTLVTFGSGTTATFTAAADIKVYDGTTLKETVAVTSVRSSGAAIQNTTSALSIADAVGTCELVQCTDGIVLYYVDGDPSAIVAKTYKPSISVNFCHGNAPLTTAADVGVGDYAVPGTSWNNMISAGGNNGTFTTPLSTIYGIDSTGAQTLISGVSVAVSGTRGSWDCGSVTAATDLRQGYIDDSGSYTSPQVVVSGIPYYSYYAVVYFSNHDANVPFGYVTINGTNYKWDSENSKLVECEGTSSDSWGASSPTAWTEGGNYIVTPTIVNSDGKFTIVSHRLSGSIRSGIAAIQIVEVPKQAADGELVINVSGDTPYTVSEDATYTTVYVTGAGTLAFDGEGTITTTTLNVGVGATVPMGSSITPTTVTGAGTVVYDGSKPTTGLGWTDPAKWTGTVWVKNITASSDERKDWNPALYGNAESTLRFTDVNIYFPNTTTTEFSGTVELDAGGLNICDGNAGSKATFAKLTGSGTLSTGGGSSSGNGLMIRDASKFTGTITLTKYKVIIGSSDGTSASGVLQIDSGAVATVASGKTWTAPGGFVVNGTLNADGTLASSHASKAVSGSGTVVFSGRAPTPAGDTWWKNSAWTGTVQIGNITDMIGRTSGYTGTYLDFNSYGNANSLVKLGNLTGWMDNYTCNVPVNLAGTLTINNGISGEVFTFKKLISSGGYITATDQSAQFSIRIEDGSEYAGYIGLNSKRVIFGTGTAPAFVKGQIYVSSDATITVPSVNTAYWSVGGILVDGELKADNLDRFGGGTNITTGDDGVFTLTSTGNGSEGETDKDYARIKGTGSLKYDGTGWRALSTNNLSTAVTLVNEQSGDILLSRALTYTVGSLSGSKNFQGNYDSGSRYLNVIQSKDTEWSGKVVNDTSSRFAGLKLDASSTGTLTLSGTASQNVALEVNGGAVNLTGTWVGATTVAGTFGGTGTLTGDLTFSDGATFKAFAADDADGLVVSGTVGYPAEGTVAVDVSAIEPEADVALIKAADLNRDKFVLADGTPEGYSLEVVDGVLTLKLPVPTTVEITIPSVDNATVSVTADGQPVDIADGKVTVDIGANVVVTYTAAEGYQLTGDAISFTASASTTTVDVSNISVAAIVANVTSADGQTTTPYTSAASAIAAADDGETVTLLENTVTLAEILTISKSITIVSGNASGTTITGSGLSVYPQLAAANLTIGANVTFGSQLRVTSCDATITYPTGSTPSYRPPSGYQSRTTDNANDTSTITFYQQVYVYTAGTNVTLYDDDGNQIGASCPVAAGSTFEFTVTPADGCTLVSVTAGGVALVPSEGKYSISIGSSNVSIYAVAGAAVVTGGDSDVYCSSLQAAVDAATSGQTVKLLADVTLADKLFVSNKTVTITADSAKTITGQLRVVDGSNVTIGTNVTITSDKHPTVFVLGDPAVKTAGTAKSTLVVNGTVLNTNAGFDKTFAIAGNGLDTQGVDITINGTVRNANGIAIYQAFPGNLVVNGTVEGASAISIKDGTLTVNDGAVITATLADGLAYVGNNNGDSPTGDAIIAPYYPLSKGYGTPVVSILGGTITVADTTNCTGIEAYDFDGTTAPQDAATNVNVSGGLFNTPVAKVYCASGYIPCEVTGGYSVKVQTTIDPTDPTSTQEVTPSEQEIADAGSAEAAAKAKATVAVPEDVATATGVTEKTYKTYFNYTVTDKGNGVYEVAVDQTKDLKEEVVLPEEVIVGEETISQAEEVLEAVTTDATNATVPAVAGIYYSLVAADNLNFTEAVEGTQTLATGATVTISKPAQLPSGTAVFFRVKASATPNNN